MFFLLNLEGLLIAWTMRFMPLWNEMSKKFIDVVQRAVRVHFKGEQVQWIGGFAYTIFSKAMVGHILFATDI